MSDPIRADRPEIGDRVLMTMRSKAQREGIVTDDSGGQVMMQDDCGHYFRRPRQDVQVLVKAADLVQEEKHEL